MKINITQPCPDCKGDKIQVHPLWATLYLRQEKEANLSAEEHFLEHHILSEAERPKIVIPCTGCQGTGEVETWVPFITFLGMLRMNLYKVLGGAPL